MRVLLVDDEKDTLRAMACFLDHSNVETLPVADSMEAARHIVNQPFDAMIMDVHMPSPDGLELTRAARRTSLNGTTPIGLITGFDDTETQSKGSEAGATCFAGKPITPQKIRSILHVLQGAASPDRRRHARLPFLTQVTCRWSSSGTRSLLAKSLNLGQGGMLLEPSGGIPVGQELQLEFEVPLVWRPLLLRAKVDRFEQPDRIAVQFLDAAGSDFEAVQSYIAQRLHKVEPEFSSGDNQGVYSFR